MSVNGEKLYECQFCGEWKPLREFPKHKGHKLGHELNGCDCCKKESKKDREMIKKKGNYPNFAGYCMLTFKLINPTLHVPHFDHDRVTKNFRGFATNSVNTSLGALGDRWIDMIAAVLFTSRPSCISDEVFLKEVVPHAIALYKAIEKCERELLEKGKPSDVRQSFGGLEWLDFIKDTTMFRKYRERLRALRGE